MFEKIYESHLGVEKYTQRTRDVLFWPNMASDIRITVLNYAVCLDHRNANRREPLKSHNIPDRPLQVVTTFLFHWNNTDYIVLVDLYSRFFEVSILTDGHKQVKHLFFSRHGISETSISDNAPQFACELFADFCKDWDIKHNPPSPFYQQANPAERTIQAIKGLLNKAK